MKKMCKTLCLTLLLAFSVSLAAIPAMADSYVTVLLDGEELAFDVPAQLIDGSSMVPMRKIFESFGAEVLWDGETQGILAIKDDVVIFMQIDNVVMSVNGEEITLAVPPQLVDGSTLVPVRVIAESLDAEVLWDGDTQTVIITSADASYEEELPWGHDLSEMDKFKLAFYPAGYTYIDDGNYDVFASAPRDSELYGMEVCFRGYTGEIFTDSSLFSGDVDSIFVIVYCLEDVEKKFLVLLGDPNHTDIDACALLNDQLVMMGGRFAGFVEGLDVPLIDFSLTGVYHEIEDWEYYEYVDLLK